jgi:imidazolonepropionase-like amidohydrolase/Tol biopolymer transport system component
VRGLATLLVALLAPCLLGAKGWDVEGSWGPRDDVTIDVREGTWMSVDVHPAGDRIVFDLLGDLYELPIAGGEARKLTDGAAWDMAPRYSPDGKGLAFVSDRGGGDNLWWMPAAAGTPAALAKQARALSKETFRLLSSPAWTPDGRFVVGRKHFTSRRSLGSGELWLYHVSGGTAGVQANVKPNEQKDLGEPACSPDGRWIYYSRDATPGGVFEYNKDPNGAIYAIFRLDRRDGRVERLIGGPGGAIRPTPSPDGRSLAWIRRHRGKTELMLRDLRTGENRRLDDDLDRDLQETWAIHGVYPHFAFTPDSRALIYWARGKIWRLALPKTAADKVAARVEIPFHVRDRRRVHRALRQPHAVAPARFPITMVRHPRMRPDGRVVAFEAMGRLWLHDVATNKRRAIGPTGEGAGLTAMPSFSGDGRSLAWVSWSDADAGRVWLAKGDGSGARVRIAEPGHHVEPALSHDGKTLVWRRGTGGWLRTSAYGVDPGLYAASAAGGSAYRFSRDGEAPHFGPEPDRVYFMRHGAAQALELWSVGLGDRSERLHARSALGQAMAMAPDGRHIGWREGYHAFVTPYAPAAKPLLVAPDGKATPQRKVSTDGADFLAFAGPGRLTFSTGPTLFAVDPAAPATPTAVVLGWDEPAAVARGTAAIVGARVVTLRAGTVPSGEGPPADASNGPVVSAATVLQDATVVWRDGRIVAVGPRATTTVPKGATILRGEGKTVIPGLVDVHGHGPQASEGLLPEQNWAMAATLAFGVTTFHDPSTDTTAFFDAAQRQRVGALRAPRMFSTGTILYGAKAPYFAPVERRDDALAHLRRLRAAGAFTAKSYNQPRRAQRQQILSAARELGMMVVPEGGALFHHNLTQVIDGHTGVEHALPLAAVYADVHQLWARTRTGHTPTLGVAYGGLGAENHWYAKTRVDLHPLLGRYVPTFAIDPRARRRQDAPDEEWNHVAAARIARDLLRAGGMVQLGAHGQREGLAAHWELWSFVQGGMTPVEALYVGSLGGARYLGLDADVGSIEVGKLADFAIVDGDPTRDIRQSDRVEQVVLGGEVLQAADLAANFPQPRAGVRFWHQQGDAVGGRQLEAGCACGLGRH